MIEDNRYVYVFVRTDLPLAQQIVQTNHATYSMVAAHKVEGIPNIVIIGVPKQKSLNKVIKTLQAENISHFAWSEPELDLGLTAIATIPVEGNQRELFRRYPMWKQDAPVAQ